MLCPAPHKIRGAKLLARKNDEGIRHIRFLPDCSQLALASFSWRLGDQGSLTEMMGIGAAAGGLNRCPVIMPLVVPKAATAQAASRPQ